MRLTMIAAGLALVSAGLLLAPAPAQAKKKTDAEELAELKAKVKAKYVDDKGGLLFNDYTYWVDMKKVGDSRWNAGSYKGGKEEEANWLTFSANYLPAVDATPEQQIEVVVWRHRHYTRKAGQQDLVHSTSFGNTGESIANSDAKKMVEANRKNWLATAKDVNEKATVEVKKKKLGEAKFMAAAEGAEAESGARVRREWYGWVNGKRGETYVASVTYGRAMMEKTDKVADLLKGTKVVSEMK